MMNVQIVFHVGTIIGAGSAVIAAVSSLRNGRILRQNGQTGTPPASSKQTPTKTTKGAPADDWYEPPDFGSTK
jgi:hypothetical protein